MSTYGFVPITAVFYAVFHPTEGTKVVYQVPENALATPLLPLNANLFVLPPPALPPLLLLLRKHLAGDSTSGLGILRRDHDMPQGLFDFNTVRNYIIPKPQLCNRLVQLKIKQYRVVGFPVLVVDERYTRNLFNFNFCFVFPFDLDPAPYENSIRRIGMMFAALEEQSHALSCQDPVFFKESHLRPPPLPLLLPRSGSVPRTASQVSTSPSLSSLPEMLKLADPPNINIQLMIQQLYQDLNQYSECLIPLDDANSLDIKLFPQLPSPPPLKPLHVPVSTVKLQLLVDFNWDPAMVKVLPFIDGINSIHRILRLANVEYELTKICIQHLAHYKCIVILDVFQFLNIYAATSKISDFLVHDMASECLEYLAFPYAFDAAGRSRPLPLTLPRRDTAIDGTSTPVSSVNGTPAGSGRGTPTTPSVHTNGASNPTTITLPAASSLFYLYRALHQGVNVKEWYMENASSLVHLDVRRFIAFGVLRGLIYRVHLYPVLEQAPTAALKPPLRFLATKPEPMLRVFEPLAGNSEYTLKVDRTRPSGSFLIETRRISFDAPHELVGFGQDTLLEELVVEEYLDQPSTHEERRLERRKRKTRESLVQHTLEMNDLDTLCTELELSRAEVLAVLHGVGTLHVVNR